MKDLEPNKVFAALLSAGIVASLSGFVATKLVSTEPLKTNAYKIEGVVSAAGAAPVVEKPQPILDMIASADPAKGQQIAKVCASCHIFDKGGPNGLGPNLYGVVGRPKGSHAGYDYSAGMKAKGGNWTYSDLNQFLYKPKAYVDGTKMGFMGLRKPADRAAVIAWLRTLSDSPLPPPTAAEIAADKAELAPEDTSGKGAAGHGEPKVSTTGNVTAGSKPESGPNPSETGTPSGTVSSQPAIKKPLEGSDATAAVPEGNAGVGTPANNPDVKQGSKPADNSSAEQTPAEKADNKLTGSNKASQPASDIPPKQTKVPLDMHPKVLPADKRDIDNSDGSKDTQGQNGGVGTGNSGTDLQNSGAPSSGPVRSGNSE